jgi:hypothetical protein
VGESSAGHHATWPTVLRPRRTLSLSFSLFPSPSLHILSNSLSFFCLYRV